MKMNPKIYASSKGFYLWQSLEEARWILLDRHVMFTVKNRVKMKKFLKIYLKSFYMYYCTTHMLELMNASRRQQISRN